MANNKMIVATSILKLSIIFLLLGVNLSEVIASQKVQRPNIIVIMADDMGQWATGFQNANIVDTPNLDYLATQGVRFENAMTPAPVCSAARASFHTGKMPSQHGVYDFLSENKKYDTGWLDDEVLLSEHLEKGGYRSALIGKWHATSTSHKPVRGFQKWLSYNAVKAGWRNQYQHSGSVLFSEDGSDVEYTGIQAQFLTDKTLEFIDQPSEKPFFVSLNYVEPHFPFEGLPERLVAKYRDKAFKLIARGGNSALDNMSDYTLVPDNHEEALAQYLAAVSLLDHQLGRLLDALQGRKMLDNTVIAFVSDHGLLMGQHGLYGKVNASFPYNFYEETVRIPFIVSGPEHLIQKQQVRGEFVDLIDLHATVLAFANIETGEDVNPGPGRSLIPMLEGKRVKDWRAFQFAERGNARMISNGQWKLVRYYLKDPDKAPIEHWYDLSHPLGERHLSPPPRMSVQTLLISELERFFTRYSTNKHSGRNIWHQPELNDSSKSNLDNPLWQ